MTPPSTLERFIEVKAIALPVAMPTHGSLTKAGKVRSQTPKIEPIPRTRPFPRRRNRRNYKVRILYPMIYGQEEQGR